MLSEGGTLREEDLAARARLVGGRPTGAVDLVHVQMRTRTPAELSEEVRLGAALAPLRRASGLQRRQGLARAAGASVRAIPPAAQAEDLGRLSEEEEEVHSKTTPLEDLARAKVLEAARVVHLGLAQQAEELLVQTRQAAPSVRITRQVARLGTQVEVPLEALVLEVVLVTLLVEVALEIMPVVVPLETMPAAVPLEAILVEVLLVVGVVQEVSGPLHRMSG